MFLVALEADGKPVLLVACDAKSWPSSRWFPHGYVRLAVTRRDGTRLPLHACDRRMFPELDAGDIVGVGPYGKNHRGEFHLMDTDDTLRLWLAGEQTIVELGLDLAPRLIGPKMLPLSGCILFRSPRSPKDGIFLASRTGSVLWQVPQGPEFDILCTMPSPSIIWCAAATEVNHRLKGSRMI